MSISELSPSATPSGVVAEAVAALRAVAETLWSARSDDELVRVVEQVQQLVAVAAAVEAGALAEVDARDVAKQSLHYGSTGDWLTHVGGLRRGEGKRRVVRARALCRSARRGPERGWSQGWCRRSRRRSSSGQWMTCRAVIWVRRRGEKVLIAQAGHLDATDLAKAGRHVAAVVDPDGVDRRLEAALERDERAAHLGRYLAITDDRAGGVRIRGSGISGGRRADQGGASAADLSRSRGRSEAATSDVTTVPGS